MEEKNWHTLYLRPNENVESKFVDFVGLRADYAFDSAESVTYLDGGKAPGFTPNLDGLYASNRGVIPDIVGSLGGFLMESFLVNSKAKEVLSQFNLPSYQVFPVNILHKSLIVKDYFLLHFCEDSSSSFSYPNVMLETREMGLKRLSTSISIASPIELKKFLDSKSLDDLLYPKDIAIKNLENFDFLFFNPFWIKNYISTNLKTALIENDISGISFSDTPVDVFKLG